MTKYVTTTPLQTHFSRTIVEQVTLRDQFAMAALTAVISLASVGNATEAAAIAYDVADRMLEARKEKK